MDASSPAWHALTAEEALERLGSGPAGLDAEEAARRLATVGPNRLPRARPVSAFRILADQFASLVVALLAVAALVALALGDRGEAIAIGAVLAINALIGFAVELRARRAMDALLRYEVPVAKVLRGGEVVETPADRLVPGDVIALEEGDRVPADARLLEAVELRTNDAPLTGESLPVHKRAEPVQDADAPPGERTSMVFCGTTVYVGRAAALVVATGPSTEIGRIGTLIAEVEASKTPLEVRLDELGHRLVWLALSVAAVVTALGTLQGLEFGRMVETGIALAIAAVPEGLPAVATIALAVGLRRMARRNAIVRRLAAVEALGSTTVVCTDKTGTLTAGEMTAVVVAGAGETVRVTGAGYASRGSFVGPDGELRPSGSPWLLRLLRAAALTSRATVDERDAVIGDPTDAALTVLARKAGVSAGDLLAGLPLVRDVPFSSARRASASVHRRAPDASPRGADARTFGGGAGDTLVVFVKGAPSTVLDLCARAVGPTGDDRALDPGSRAAILEENERLAAQGLRVIALAEGEGDLLERLTFLGLVGIADPPAEGVPETIALLRAAGIRTVMITGDQRATAERVARDLGLLAEGERALDARELRALSDAELAPAGGPIGVFSRVSPEDKLRIVAALQAQGEIVAMLGDGVNDAAALKKADVSVAMGRRGTDVAKETASIVLQDDRFTTIGAAVEEGRTIFENIRKFVFYLFSCNVAEVLVLLVASVAGFPLPLLPLQILWLNLVTDTFPALALALEPAEPDVMRRPPREPDAAILSHRFLRAMAWYASLITAATLLAYAWALGDGGEGRAGTVAFMTLALAQLFHLGNARSREPVLAWRRVVANPWALGAVPLVVSLQLATVYWPALASVLGTVRLEAEDWIAIVPLALAPALVGQLTRSLQARRARA